MRFAAGNDSKKKASPPDPNTGAESKPLVAAFKTAPVPPPAAEPPAAGAPGATLPPPPQAIPPAPNVSIPAPPPVHKEASIPKSTGAVALPPSIPDVPHSAPGAGPHLQGGRSSFSKADSHDEKKVVSKGSPVNTARFGGLASGGSPSNSPLSTSASLPKMDPASYHIPAPAASIPGFAGGDEAMDTIYEETPEDRIIEAKISASRALLKQCREAGLIAIEEAVKLVPSPEELYVNTSQLQLISHKIGAQSPATLQKAICASLSIPVYSIKSFPAFRKAVPLAVIDAFKMNRMVVLDMEHTDLQDGRKHGHITIGAEHPFYEEYILEICHTNYLDVLFAFTIVIDINDLLSINPNDVTSK